MKVFINSRAIKGPYGGANSFLNALSKELRRHGVKVTHNAEEDLDVALLNALSPGVNLDLVKDIHAKGIPILHRKTGYLFRGPPEMHRVVDGVVWGDKLQIDFTPYVHTSIFQSYYSKDVFFSQGFDGRCVVINNGVNEKIFNPFIRTGLFGTRRKMRPFWDRQSPLRVIISTWSNNYNKGFHYYRDIDRSLGGRKDVVEVALVGRMPDDLTFEHIRVYEPRAHPQLAALLRQYHVLLQLSQGESCSNAMIEGINCGLPVIYLDHGANKEIGGQYGVEFQGDFFAAVERLKADYHALVEQTMINPYRISLVARHYLYLLYRVYRE
jgi:glycosyltransferase involved in cell wall biosynthesis